MTTPLSPPPPPPPPPARSAAMAQQPEVKTAKIAPPLKLKKYHAPPTGYVLVFYAPTPDVQIYKDAVFGVGAGRHPDGRFTERSWETEGLSQLRLAHPDPQSDEEGIFHQMSETRVETLCIGEEIMYNAIEAMKRVHPERRPEYHVYRLEIYTRPERPPKEKSAKDKKKPEEGNDPAGATEHPITAEENTQTQDAAEGPVTTIPETGEASTSETAQSAETVETVQNSDQQS